MVYAVVRPATAADAEALARSRYEFQAEEKPTPPDDGYVAATADWLRVRLASPTWLAWLADIDGDVVGHVFLQRVEKVPHPDPGHTSWLGYLTNFYVAAPHRNKGIGTELLRALFLVAMAEPLDTVVVWPSDDSIPLYRRLGFTRPQELLEYRISN